MSPGSAPGRAGAALLVYICVIGGIAPVRSRLLWSFGPVRLGAPITPGALHLHLLFYLSIFRCIQQQLRRNFILIFATNVCNLLDDNLLFIRHDDDKKVI